MVGGRFTAADIMVAEIVRYAQGYAPLFDARPALKAWLEACQARAAFKAMWERRLQGTGLTRSTVSISSRSQSRNARTLAGGRLPERVTR